MLLKGRRASQQYVKYIRLVDFFLKIAFSENNKEILKKKEERKMMKKTILNIFSGSINIRRIWSELRSWINAWSVN